MANKLSRERLATYAIFESGRDDMEQIAREVGAHRSTIYRWRQDWEHEKALRAIEAAKPKQLAVLLAVFGQLWRWAPEDRAWVLAVARELERRLVFRDEDAEPPPDYDEVDVLTRLTFPEEESRSEDFSEVVTAGVSAGREQLDDA